MTEQPIQVLEVVFGFLCGFLTKFLLHFIDVHRDASPATKADDLCIRSLRKLRAFALGSSFTPLPLVWTAFPSSDYYALSATSSGHWLFGERLPLSYFPSAFASLRKLPVFSKKDSNAMP